MSQADDQPGVLGGVFIEAPPLRGLGRTQVLLRNWPPCERASMTISFFEKVRSINPYWSSSPYAVGRPSEVIPPPPPETTYAVGRIKLSSSM